MEQNVQDLKQALTARSHTATLEELQSKGRRSVRVIRADDVAEMIQAAVNQAIAASRVQPQDAAAVEQRSREEFQRLLERRQAEAAELAGIRRERDEIADRLRNSELQREQLVAAVRMFETQRVEAAAAAPLPAANADALAGALQKLTNTFTAKLESFGKKMGISAAVEADAPSLTNLFKHEEEVKLESNMDNMSIKAKSATGIAANLERLKKLKSGG